MIVTLPDQVQAYLAASPSGRLTALRAERAQLTARLAEIDAELEAADPSLSAP